MEKQEETSAPVFKRRALLRAGMGVGVLQALVFLPERAAQAAPATLPDIQFDIGSSIAPVISVNGVQFHFGPVYTELLTATLTRNPTLQDQNTLAAALNTIESNYPFSPSGVFVFTSHGLPYFDRLPAAVVAAQCPG